MGTKGTIKPEYVKERSGVRFVLYAGLLDCAHEVSGGRLQISTTLVQIPAADNGNVAICAAEARITDEHGQVVRSASGIGDADPKNVNKMVANCLVRMAETRAKARALRDLVNAAEALEDDPTDRATGDTAPPEPERAAPPPPPAAAAAPAPAVAEPDPEREVAVDAYGLAWDRAHAAGVAGKYPRDVPPTAGVAEIRKATDTLRERFYSRADAAATAAPAAAAVRS